MFEFVIRQRLAQFDLDSVEGRVSALRAAAPVVADIRDTALRPGYTRELSRLLGTELAEVQRAVTVASKRSTRDLASQAESPRERLGEPGDETAARPYSITELPGDPATRLERDALMAMLQHPSLVGRDLIARATQTGFSNASLAVVRDGIASAVETIEAPDWLGGVVAEVPEPLRPFVQQLAVAPIPERSERELAGYVTGITRSLIARDLLRRKTDLLGRLQRTDPSDRDTYAAVQMGLVQLEAERRALRVE